MLLYTYATQRPIGTRARFLHVGPPAHVYTVPTAGSPTFERTGPYATVRARADHTWTHPPTCAPYTAVPVLTSARAPVVILHTSLLSFRYVLVATSRARPRRRPGRFLQLRAMQGQKPLRADAHAPWLVHELAVYNAAASTDSESACSGPPHANQTDPPILSRHPPATSETSSDGDEDIPLQQLFAQPPIDGHDDVPAAGACGQPMIPNRAPAATPAGPAFQPRRILRSEPRPAAGAAGHAGAPADSSVAVVPPPPSQATRSSTLPLAGAASRTVDADPGPPVELPPPPMSPLPVAGTAAPRADPVAPYAAPPSLTALPPAGREATSSLGRDFTAHTAPAWWRSSVSSVRSMWPGSSMEHRRRRSR